MTASFALSVLGGMQVNGLPNHVERSCEWLSTKVRKKSEIGSSLVRHLIPNHSCKALPFVCRREEGEGLALYDECEMGNPCAGCESNDDLIPVPDGDADRLYEYPLQEDRGNGEAKKTRLTCEARSVTKKRRGSGSQRPRRKCGCKALSHLRLERIGELAHECERDPDLEIVAHQARA